MENSKTHSHCCPFLLQIQLTLNTGAGGSGHASSTAENPCVTFDAPKTSLKSAVD